MSGRAPADSIAGDERNNRRTAIQTSHVNLPVETPDPSESNAGRFAGRGTSGDRIFTLSLGAAAATVFAIIGAIAVFLAAQAVPVFRDTGLAFFTEKTWFPDATPPIYGIAALVFGTVVSSICALVIALPVAVGTALFVVEVAPKRIAWVVGNLVDLLASVPSVVYGLWGVFVIVPVLIPVQKALDGWLGFIPLFHSRTEIYGRSLFAAAVVLAVMILPIIAALTREVLSTVPRGHKEAALALGATKWEVIRLAILPFGRSGIVGAAMLGLGRALGETIAVALVLAATFDINWHIFEPGGNTIAANIATKFGEAGIDGRQALIASGLVLFVLTFVVNLMARAFVLRTTRLRRGRS